MSVSIVAHWKARSGNAGTVAGILPDIARASPAEPGCPAWTAGRSEREKNEFVLLEEYADHAAPAARQATARYRELILEQVVPLLADRKVARYRPAARRG
ncbi:antibiotic biosynthesis monooxygenase [Streptomyces sp. CAU 1734]|uniref:putative quinol monooxygenase n=1 Tax=Streptomyces sp. CAU 1734 TaxID=3140360 RepID=UPI00326177CF